MSMRRLSKQWSPRPDTILAPTARQTRSASFSLAARRPHEDVFEKDTLIAARKQNVAFRASDLAAVPTTWGIDSDNLVPRPAAGTAEKDWLGAMHA